MLPEALSDLFKFDIRTLQVAGRESKTREFKEALNPDDLVLYTKVLASFANAEGGTLIFGVSNAPRFIVGIDPASIVDEARLVDRLREDFEPEVSIHTKEYDVKGKKIFAIFAPKARNRPIICRKTRTRKVIDKKGKGQEIPILVGGTIYFRYAGQTKHIEHSELAALLDEREQMRIKVILDTLKAVERVGYDRVGVVDVTKLDKPGTSTSLYISHETAKGLHFIDKGQFVEDQGAPAYVVVGNVQLNRVLHGPLDDADKNFPTEVAEELKPLVRRIFGSACKIAASQVTKLLNYHNLNELPYSYYDTKVKRRYVTREGKKELKSKIELDPIGSIRAFGSRSAIEYFEKSLNAGQR